MKFEMLKCDKCGKKFEISAMSDCFQVNIESLHMADGTFSELNVAELCPECHKQFLNYIRSYCSRGRFAPLDAPNEDDNRCHNCKHYPKNGITANAICLKCDDHSEYVSKDISLKSWEPSETLASSIEAYKALEKHSETSEAAKDDKPPIKYDDPYKLWNKASEIEAENNKPKKVSMGRHKNKMTYGGNPTKRGDLRFYIIQNELTPSQIAEKCGVCLSYVYKIKKDMKDKGEI